MFEFDGPLFRLALNTPEFVPLFQLPPRMTAPAQTSAWKVLWIGAPIFFPIKLVGA